MSRIPRRPFCLLFMTAALFYSHFGEVAWSQPPGGKSADRPASVTAGPVRTGQAGSAYQLLGTVRPSRRTTIGCALAGRVQELHAKRGRRLSAGDPIAQLRTDVIDIEIAAAKAELRLVEQQLAELQAGSRPEDIAEAKARMQAAGAISQRTSSQLSRVLKLVQSRAVSIDEVDTATADANSSEQLQLAAKIAYERLVAGPREEQVAQAKASVDLQKEQVRLLEDRRKKHTIVAPFDGYITAEYTEAGAWVTSGAAVVDLIELDTVEVEVAVPASQIVSLRPGQSIRVECEQHPDELLIGQLDRIVPSADTRARTFPVLIKIENLIEEERPVLMSGMVVRIDLPLGPSRTMTFVPTDAIVLDRLRQSVFVVDLGKTDQASQGTVGGTVRRVPVNLGVADGGWVSIDGQLDADSLVITRGNERLTDGQTVEVTVQGG